MEKVSHRRSQDRAIWLKKYRTDIHERHIALVAKRLQQSVQLGGFQSSCVCRLLTTRKNGEKKDLAVRLLLVNLVNDGLNTVPNLLRCIDEQVIRADHEAYRLQRHVIQFALLQPPYHILGSVPPKSKIDGVTVAIVFLPNRGWLLESAV